SKTKWAHGFRGQLMKKVGIDCKKPVNKLSAKDRDKLLYGTGDKTYRVTWEGSSGKGHLDITWEGILPRLMRRFASSQSEKVKRHYGKYMGDAPCMSCRGARLRKES